SSLRSDGSCDTESRLMKPCFRSLIPATLVLAALFLTSCVTETTGLQQSRSLVAQQIAAEPPGDYFIGRRYYKPDFKFWGYVRRPGAPWSTAQLVMLNEKDKLAPDRE